MRACSALLLVIATAGLVTASNQLKPVKSADPLSADEIAIYREILLNYASTESGSLNVSARTFPLDPNDPTTGLARGDCANIQLDGAKPVSRTFHDLTVDVLPGKNMRLVDPKKQARIVHENDPSRTIRGGKSVDAAVRSAFSAGLFSLSEIAFDKDHLRAVVSYSFWCGSLCGHGSTLVFEKQSDGWHKIGAECSGWVS